jgi:hypothetical protein
MSPLRDPLGFDGSAKPVGGSGPLLLRRLLPGCDLWWSWRHSKRSAPRPDPAQPEQGIEDLVEHQKQDGQ